MAFNLAHVTLAELDVPDAATVNAHLTELLQPGGERVGLSGEYEARDPSGTLRISVDARGKPTGADIRHGWAARIPAERLAGALFRTYVTAVQRALVVELANAGEPAGPVAGVRFADPDAQPHDAWLAGIHARIGAIDAQLEDIHRRDANRTPPVAREVRSPHGFFVLHLRGASPERLTASVGALANAGADRLRLDFLEVFAAAGLAAPAVRPSPRSARVPVEDDEDAFAFRYDV